MSGVPVALLQMAPQGKTWSQRGHGERFCGGGGEGGRRRAHAGNVSIDTLGQTEREGWREAFQAKALRKDCPWVSVSPTWRGADMASASLIWKLDNGLRNTLTLCDRHGAECSPSARCTSDFKHMSGT
jgi:hypothetical protein